MRSSSFCLTLLLALGGCASTETAAPAAEDLPLFGSLETRLGRVTIHLGPEGPLYSIAASSAAPGLTRVSETELTRRRPELHALLRGSLATGADSLGPLMHLGYLEVERRGED